MADTLEGIDDEIDDLLDIGLRAAVEMILRDMEARGELVCDDTGIWRRTEKGWRVIAEKEGYTSLGQFDTWEGLCRHHALVETIQVDG